MEVKVTYSTSARNPNVQDFQLEILAADGTRHTLMENSDHGTLSVGTGAGGKTLTLHNADGTTSDVTNLSTGMLKGVLDMLNKAGSFDGSDTRGIGYYEQMLDVLANQLATVINQANRAPNPAYDPPLVNDEFLERPLFDAGGSATVTAKTSRWPRAGKTGTTASPPPKPPGTTTARRWTI